MRRLLPLLLVLLLVLPAVGVAVAEDEARTTCGMYALVDPGDAGMLATYDGLRKGLELAQLPRVCRHDPAAKTGGVTGFLERQAAAAAPLREAGKTIEPIFAVGDASCAAVLAARGTHPCVMAVARYTAQRQPLVALPAPARGAVVYADMASERVGQILRSFLGKDPLKALRPRADRQPGAALDRAFGKAASVDVSRGIVEITLSENIGGTGKPEPHPPYVSVVLHLRLDPSKPPASFAKALALAREHKVPLVSDNPAHFGQGAVVVLVPRHDLLGRAAADAARNLRADSTYAPKPRVVPGMEVWVDLAAAQALGVELPLPFLARADKLRRGRRPAPKPKVAR